MSFSGIKNVVGVVRDLVRFFEENPDLVRDIREVIEHARKLLAVVRRVNAEHPTRPSE